MFRASRADAFLDADRPAWVDQLLSPESLRATGWFDPVAVARERAAQVRFPRFTPKRIIMDLSLTCVVATQLWHHILPGRRPVRAAHVGACGARGPRAHRTSCAAPVATGRHPTRRWPRPADGLGSGVERVFDLAGLFARVLARPGRCPAGPATTTLRK